MLDLFKLGVCEYCFESNSTAPFLASALIKELAFLALPCTVNAMNDAALFDSNHYSHALSLNQFTVFLFMNWFCHLECSSNENM